jgi:hypothetical protein
MLTERKMLHGSFLFFNKKEITRKKLILSVRSEAEATTVANSPYRV